MNDETPNQSKYKNIQAVPRVNLVKAREKRTKYSLVTQLENEIADIFQTKLIPYNGEAVHDITVTITDGNKPGEGKLCVNIPRVFHRERKSSDQISPTVEEVPLRGQDTLIEGLADIGRKYPPFSACFTTVGEESNMNQYAFTFSKIGTLIKIINEMNETVHIDDEVTNMRPIDFGKYIDISDKPEQGVIGSVSNNHDWLLDKRGQNNQQR